MSKPVYVNGTEILGKYKAKLLDYSIGAVSISDSHLARKNSIIPVKLKPAIGTRPITLKLEFEGDTCHEALLNISNMTAVLMQENDIFLPDGFYYYCLLSDVSTPKLEGGTFYSAVFTLIGYRHLKMVSEMLTETSTINVLGNLESPAIFRIMNSVGTFTINGIQIEKTGAADVVINGYDKTVIQTDGVTVTNKFKDCKMSKFPSLKPGPNLIEITGQGDVIIEYTPILL